ncbi:DNA repair and recombination protein RAD54 [Platanthera guangdongensis]|uniref:ATP-dependent helicase ATRX n=1 Tax=Platanthera guangdongensis TaxID=2320717 RepID=A0ABR2MG87_9ASPA
MEDKKDSVKFVKGKGDKDSFNLECQMKEENSQRDTLQSVRSEQMVAFGFTEDDLDRNDSESDDKGVKIVESNGALEDCDSDSVATLGEDLDVESSSLSSGNDDGNISEVPLTDLEIEELVAEFFEIESKAAEAQESLEKESLAQVENDVREELAQNLHGDALNFAISTEMQTFREEWEAVLDDLETKSAQLLEQLDGCGIELTSLYRWIESQAPNGCRTEAWKKRTHWVGSQVSNDVNLSVKEAEKYLHAHNPVPRQHGRLLEVGASGFLARKLSIGGKDEIPDWNSFNELIQFQRSSQSTSFASKNWAAVYLANTPLQAANMGLNFPGVDEVEEIGEIDFDSRDPFYSDAIANEKEIDLTEVQKRNFRKVREEDDVNLTHRLQQRLKRQRQKSQRSRVPDDVEALTGVFSTEYPQVDFVLQCQSDNGFMGANGGDISAEPMGDCMRNSSENATCNFNGDWKHALDIEEFEMKIKRRKTVFLESDDEFLVVEEKATPSVHGEANAEQYSSMQVKTIDVIDVDSVSSSDLDIHKNFGKVFLCTSCFDVLKAPQVHRHPLLQVAVCGSCKAVIEGKMQVKSDASSEFCAWCGTCDDLVNCSNCKMLFCATCISRNFSDDHLSKAKDTGWHCYCCLPFLLHRFVMDCNKALEGLASGSDNDSEFSDVDVNVSISKRQKKKIRRILDDTELGEETKEKIAIEKARQEYLKSMQVKSAKKSYGRTLAEINRSTSSILTLRMLDDPAEGYVVNIAREDDEEPVKIVSSLSMKLKPHQVEGIRFMWENIIQSVRMVKSGDKGLGCILAHTMGLGKTFQVIAFLYTAMRSVDLGLRTALIVTPVNVLHNWRHEFFKWKPTELKPLRVWMLEDVVREKRAHLLAKWRSKGGIFLIGYSAFRNLSLGRHVKDKTIASEICHALQYGPDVLVCDEAHMIKNTRADITLALKQVQTQRRIALTGSPLQNNLMEYYCMVDFVREGFLGSSHEFRNRFQNPIENGQHTNSTARDVKIMNQRSHILYEQLKGFVQRVDMNVVKKDLPPKTVFVITVKLSPLQRKLYRRFLDLHGFTVDKVSSDRGMRRSSFFAGYQALAQIWNHPGLLQMAKEHKDSLKREYAVENFIVDDLFSDDTGEQNDFNNGEKLKSKNDFTSKLNHEDNEWWKDLLDDKMCKEVECSGKMVLLLDILSMSSEVGDKALVFSQSLTTLDMIELFLSKFRRGSEGKYWKKGKDWYRLDGRTDGSERQKLVDRFNEPSNTRVKCTLISTRAGALGINLHAANRVILVDGSWNPTYDLQAIFRVWRYGQNKPVYAYRLLAHGTMEEKIYKRQVTKEGLAARVVDRQQIHRTMSKEEILHLFDFGDEENLNMHDDSQGKLVLFDQAKFRCSQQSTSHSSDKIMESLLSRHKSRWIANYHEHETLLQENEEEKLSKEEQEMAWVSFQRSLEWEEVHRARPSDDIDRKPAAAQVAPAETSAPPQQSKGSLRNHPPPAHHPRKCSNLDHLLTLRSKGIRSGSTTECQKCSQEISWENLNRDGRTK